MHIAIHIGERSHDGWVQRIVQIEDESLSGVVIVGEEHAAGRHGVFRMVNIAGGLVGRESGYEMTVRGRGRIGVDDGEKVIALGSLIAGPREKIVAG